MKALDWTIRALLTIPPRCLEVSDAVRLTTRCHIPLRLETCRRAKFEDFTKGKMWFSVFCPTKPFRLIFTNFHRGPGTSIFKVNGDTAKAVYLFNVHDTVRTGRMSTIERGQGKFVPVQTTKVWKELNCKFTHSYPRH
jgi:hypothetical protein